MANYKYSLPQSGINASKRHIHAGEIYEMHWHDYIELEVILCGKAEHIYNSEAYELSEGDAYIVTHHDLHAFRAISDITLVNIGFDINLLDDTLAHSLLYSTEKRFNCTFDNELSEHIYNLCEMLIFEHTNVCVHSVIMCKLIVSQLIINILRASPIQKSSPSLSQKVLEYIHLNFKNEMSLGMVADILSVTPNYLGRVFNESTGMSFNEYLNQIRLRYVCNMLLYSSLSVKEIAEMSGYSSVEYLFYTFKKQFSTTPANYRKVNSNMLSKSYVNTNSILNNNKSKFQTIKKTN